MPLYDYQERAVAEIRQEYSRGNRRVVLVLPTGAGKTVTAAHMLRQAVGRGKQCLVLVHRKELLSQFSAAVADIPHGFIAPGYDIGTEPLHLGMVQTLVRRLGKVPRPYDFVVTDEAHHATSHSYRKILDTFPRAYSLGLTATPERTDGNGLGDIYDALVRGPEVDELIKRGRLSPFRVWQPPMAMDLRSLHKRGGDYAQDELANLMANPVIYGDAIGHYERLARGSKFIVFTAGVANAIAAAAQFTEAGYPCVALHGKMPAEERSAAVAALSGDSLLGIASCDLVSEGFDVQALETLIGLRPTESLIVHRQQLGRVLRYVPGKTAKIIDHVGNTIRLGMPDEVIDWSLDGKAKSRREACVEVDPLEPVVPGERLGPHYVDGELVDATEQAERVAELRSGSLKRRLQDCDTPEKLRELQEARGYKRGFLIHGLKDYFGMTFEQAARFAGMSEVYIRKAQERRA